MCLKQMEQKKINTGHEGSQSLINQIMEVVTGRGGPTSYTNSESSDRSIWKNEAEQQLNQAACQDKLPQSIREVKEHPNSQHYMHNVK